MSQLQEAVVLTACCPSELAVLYMPGPGNSAESFLAPAWKKHKGSQSKTITSGRRGVRIGQETAKGAEERFRLTVNRF